LSYLKLPASEVLRIAKLVATNIQLIRDRRVAAVVKAEQNRYQGWLWRTFPFLVPSDDAIRRYVQEDLRCRPPHEPLSILYGWRAMDVATRLIRAIELAGDCEVLVDSRDLEDLNLWDKGWDGAASHEEE
jgi:hypothetical protein